MFSKFFSALILLGSISALASGIVDSEIICPTPDSEAVSLFKMLRLGSPTQTIKAFLQAHPVAENVLDEGCKTPLETAIDLGRSDLVLLFFDQWNPVLSDPEIVSRIGTHRDPFPFNESVYSYVLAHSSPSMLVFLKSLASSHHQDLSLAPVEEENLYTRGTTPLMVAAIQNRSVQMINYLMANGAMVNASDSSGFTPLMLAGARNPNSQVVQAFIRAGANVNAVAKDGTTPLIATTQYGHFGSLTDRLDVIKSLIQAEAYVNAADEKGFTGVMYVEGGGESGAEIIIRLLIQAGANVNAVTKNGSTPLMQASLAPWTDSAKSKLFQILIRAGAHVNATDEEGQTPLMYAAAWGAEEDVIETLIRAGANVNSAAKDGSTALIKETSSQVTRDDLPVVQTMIHNGANVNAVDDNGYSPLLFAVGPITRNLNVAEALIDAGADVNVTTKDREPRCSNMHKVAI